MPFYPWSAGVAFCALTAFIFLLCLDDPLQRRAAFAAFGISALLTGPAYVWNQKMLTRFAPETSLWIAPHLSLFLMVLCLGSSAALLVWWLRRLPSVSSHGPRSALLFFGLLLVLLIIPAVTNWCGIESMRIITALASDADAHRQTNDTLVRFLVQGEAGSVGDVVGFLIQWIGLAVSMLTLLFVWVVLRANRMQKRPAESGTNAFPSRVDLLPLLLFVMGFLLDGLTSYAFGNLKDQIAGVEHTMERPVYPYHAGLWAVEILGALVFLTGSWLVLRRIQTASQMRFKFSLIVPIASGVFSLCQFGSDRGFENIVAILALNLSALQILVFFHPKGRARWISSAFAAPSETALSFATEGSVILAVLASGLWAVAIELAFISVFAIRYFIMWGNALKPLHGHAPTDKIVPMVAPSLATVTIAVGPVYFAICLFGSVTAVLLFSLVYSGGCGCAKLFRRARTSSRSPAVKSSDTFIEHRLGNTPI